MFLKLPRPLMLKIISKVGRQRSDRNWVPSLLFSKRCSKDHLSVRSGKFENLLRACPPAATYLNALPVLCEKQVFLGAARSTFSTIFPPRRVSRWTPNMDLSWTSSWEGFWRRLGAVLGASLGVLGASCGVLVASWGVLGRLGGVLWRLGASWAQLGRAFGRLGSVWYVFGTSCGRVGASCGFRGVWGAMVSNLLSQRLPSLFQDSAQRSPVVPPPPAARRPSETPSRARVSREAA